MVGGPSEVYAMVVRAGTALLRAGSDGALRNLLITFRISAIFLVISGKRYIFAEKSNV